MDLSIRVYPYVQSNKGKFLLARGTWNLVSIGPRPSFSFIFCPSVFFLFFFLGTHLIIPAIIRMWPRAEETIWPTFTVADVSSWSPPPAKALLFQPVVCGIIPRF